MDLIGKCLVGLILLTIWCRVIENIDFVEPIVKQSASWLFEFFRFVVKTCITFGFWSFIIVLVYNIFWLIFCSELRYLENPLGSERTLKYDGGGRPIPANVRWSKDKPWWDWEIIPKISDVNIINFCNRFKQTKEDNQKFLKNMQHVIPGAAVSKAAVSEKVLNSTAIRPSRTRNFRNYTTITGGQFNELENISPIRRPADTFDENLLRAQIQKQMEIQEKVQKQRQVEKQQLERQQHQQQQYTKQNHFIPNYNNGSGDQLSNSGVWKINSQKNSISKPSNHTISSFKHRPENSWYNHYSQNSRK